MIYGHQAMQAMQGITSPQAPRAQALPKHFPLQVEAELAKPDGCFKGAPEALTPPALALAALFAPAVCPPEYSGKFAPEPGGLGVGGWGW